MSDGIKKWFLKEWTHVLFWILFVWVVFGYSLFFDFFIFDDHLHFYDNKHVGVRGWGDLLHFWMNSLTPVIFFVWQLIALAFGNSSPTAFRVFNFLLMGGIGFLLFKILKEFVKEFTEKNQNLYKFLPYFATAIYIIHPSQVESVIWVSSGRTLLATFFALLSVRMFQISELKIDKKKYEYLTVAFFILGILSKPSIVMLPFLLVGIQLIKGKNLKDSLSRVFPLLLVGLILGLLHSIDVLTPHLKGMSLKTRSLVYLDSVIFYLKMVFLPFETVFNYGRNPQQVLSEFSQNKAFFILLPFTFLIFLIVSLFTKTLKGFGFFLCLFFVLLVPNMGLIQYDFQNISTVSNRYLNFPLIALAIGLLFFGKIMIDKWHDRKALLTSVGVGVILFFLTLSYRAGYQWNSSENLLLSGAGNRLYANAMSLGLYYHRRGEFKKAEDSFYKAWDADSTSLSPVIGLIDLFKKYSFKGRIEDFLRRLEKDKIVVPSYKSLALAELHYEIGSYKQALQLSGVAFQAQIKVNESKSLFKRAEQALKQKKLQAYLALIELYLDENRNQKAYETAMEAKGELGNLPELESIFANELKAYKK